MVLRKNSRNACEVKGSLNRFNRVRESARLGRFDTDRAGSSARIRSIRHSDDLPRHQECGEDRAEV